MNLKRFMMLHEARVDRHLSGGISETGPQTLRETHARMIGYVQHERLVHLIVTLSFAGFLLVALGIALIKPGLPVLLLLALLFVVLVPYIIHYRYLENTVQRWYRLAEQLADGIRRP